MKFFARIAKFIFHDSARNTSVTPLVTAGKATIKGAPILTALEELQKCDPKWTDGQLLQSYLQFTTTVQTNCDDAAQQMFAMAEKVTALRPSLKGLLLRKALEPIYFLGIEEPDALIEWVSYYRKRVEPHYGDQEPMGLEWINAMAANERELVVEAFKYLKQYGCASFPEIADAG